MSTPLDSEHLAARILAISGVAEIFPLSPPISQLSAAGIRARSTIRPDRIEVKETPSGARITAKIATTADQPARETARRVADALLAEAEPDTTVSVKIARIS
ncbi:hypothetical protein [Cryobacterium psychrophilum]|uniref:Uncharacterized protein n=1 Tax=Cryobacterium psychrophilum TaxID=41988 RepID=A0A4Y8KTE2_9MICO|nr:hypothetical protein [Cryobacterium psychrophilum]TDW29625.1 hypothetical protein EDD25_1335 [Cryobacterium psychrophilum]TFD81748.1 hypothetical protein E3T53_01750 [Cryobacterium psychrophilum]